MKRKSRRSEVPTIAVVKTTPMVLTAITAWASAYGALRFTSPAAPTTTTASEAIRAKAKRKSTPKYSQVTARFR